MSTTERLIGACRVVPRSGQPNWCFQHDAQADDADVCRRYAAATALLDDYAREVLDDFARYLAQHYTGRGRSHAAQTVHDYGQERYGR